MKLNPTIEAAVAAALTRNILNGIEVTTTYGDYPTINITPYTTTVKNWNNVLECAQVGEHDYKIVGAPGTTLISLGESNMRDYYLLDIQHCEFEVGEEKCLAIIVEQEDGLLKQIHVGGITMIPDHLLLKLTGQ